MQLLFLVLFVPLWGFSLCSGIIFLLLKGLPLTFPLGQVCWWWILSAFSRLKKFVSPSFWNVFLMSIDFSVDRVVVVFFFFFSKVLAPLSSHLHCFQQESWCHPYFDSVLPNVSFFSGDFEIFLFITGLNRVFFNGVSRCWFLHVSGA